MVNQRSHSQKSKQQVENVNKAYPKDSYLLPRIDLLVDFTVGHQLLSFMDTFF